MILNGLQTAVLVATSLIMSANGLLTQGSEVATAVRANAEPVVRTTRMERITHEAWSSQKTRGPVRSLTFCDDGRSALSGRTDWTATLWDVVSGKELRSFSGEAGQLPINVPLACSPDGRFVASGFKGKTARLWDVASGKKISDFRTSTTGWLLSVAFSPDGRFLLSGNSGGLPFDVPMVSDFGVALLNRWLPKLILWNRATGKEVRRFRGHTDEVCTVGFSADGRVAYSASQDSTIRIWDPSSATQIRTIIVPESYWCRATFSGRGQLALSQALRDVAVKVWDLTSGKEIRTFRHPSTARSITAMAVSPDARLVLVGTRDGALHLWDTTSWEEIGLVRPGTNEDFMTSLAFAPDGHSFLAGTWKGFILHFAVR